MAFSLTPLKPEIQNLVQINDGIKHEFLYQTGQFDAVKYRLENQAPLKEFNCQKCSSLNAGNKT